MEFGLLLSCPPAIPPDKRFSFIRQIATRAQSAGMTVVVAGQHFADPDQQTMQPIPLLSALAPLVSLKLMTGVLLAPLYNPLEVAETVMTLDLISHGRVVLGLGAGHRAEELAAFGVPQRDRGPRLEDFVLSLRRLWSPEPGVPEQQISISPAGWRRPPIWLAASSDAGVRRAARVGDAWYVGPGTPMLTLARQLAIYREVAAASDRQLPVIQPIRRDILVSTSGTRDLRQVLRRRYASQDTWGYASDLPPRVRQARREVLEGRAPLEAIVGDEVIAGSPEECADQLIRVGEIVGTETLVIIRAGWPVTSGSAYLDELDAVLGLCAQMLTLQPRGKEKPSAPGS